MSVGTLGTDGLLNGRGVAVKVASGGITLQIYDTSLETVTLSSYDYSGGVIKIGFIWDGVDTLSVYGAKGLGNTYEIPQVSLLGSLTYSTTVSNNYASERGLRFTHMVNSGAITSRTIRIRDVKSIYSF